MTRLISVALPSTAWRLVVRTLRGGPKRTDATQLQRIIDSIEGAGNEQR